jgi:hypothetical protein
MPVAGIVVEQWTTHNRYILHQVPNDIQARGAVAAVVLTGQHLACFVSHLEAREMSCLVSVPNCLQILWLMGKSSPSQSPSLLAIGLIWNVSR